MMFKAASIFPFDVLRASSFKCSSTNPMATSVANCSLYISLLSMSATAREEEEATSLSPTAATTDVVSSESRCCCCCDEVPWGLLLPISCVPHTEEEPSSVDGITEELGAPRAMLAKGAKGAGHGFSSKTRRATGSGRAIDAPSGMFEDSPNLIRDDIDEEDDEGGGRREK